MWVAIRLYIDIDGVILKPALPGEHLTLQRLADDVEDFLEWAVGRFECYWLSAWAINGDSRLLRARLLPRLPPSAQRVKLARWKRLKTDAFRDGRFLWIDDEIYSEEQEFLKSRGWSERFIHVDPRVRSLTPVRSLLEARAQALFATDEAPSPKSNRPRTRSSRPPRRTAGKSPARHRPA